MAEAVPRRAPVHPRPRTLPRWVVRFLRHRLGAVALATIGVLVFEVLAGPLIWHRRYTMTDFAALKRPPSIEHPMGTDALGRDVFSRVLVGGRISLAVGAGSQLIALALAVPIGITAGFLGRGVDAWTMRSIDVLLAVPDLLLIVLLMPLLTGLLAGPKLPRWLLQTQDATGGALGVAVALGLTSWMPLARLVRAQTLSLRQQEFVEAAVAGGAGPMRIVARHLSPNLASVLVVAFTLGVPRAMLLEAAVSFLGLGVRPPLPSWGVMISEGVNVMQSTPHLLVFPAVALGGAVLALNLAGDAIRDVLDPRGAS
jgi:ABC-type dipeptide/oligopeptide/nickel transport system permease subunit